MRIFGSAGGLGGALTETAVALALAARNLTDSQARATIGSADTLVIGLRSVGLLGGTPTPTPVPTPTPTPTPEPTPEPTDPVPNSRKAPTIQGTALVGNTLTSTPGTWTGSPTALAYQWYAAGYPIQGATDLVYTVTQQDAGKAISIAEFATNEYGTSRPAFSGPTLPVANDDGAADPFFPVPAMKVAPGGAGIFPPEFVVTIPNEAQADDVAFRIERAPIGDVLFANVLGTYSGPISNDQAQAQAVTGLFAGISDPATYRMRLETLDGKVVGRWSNAIVHGDVTAPVVTAAPLSIGERQKLVYTVSLNEVGYVALSGADASLLEVVNPGTAATSFTVRLRDNGPLDYEVKPAYDFNVVATDLADNVSAPKACRIDVTDVDENPDGMTFASVEKASPATSYTSSEYTVAGLASGIDVPVSVTGGAYSKNGGAFTANVGTVTNGDKLRVQLTTGAVNGSYVASLKVGGVTAAFPVTVGGTTFNTARSSNYAVFDPNKTGVRTISGLGAGAGAVSTTSKSSGYHYFEFGPYAEDGNTPWIGVGPNNPDLSGNTSFEPVPAGAVLLQQDRYVYSDTGFTGRDLAFADDDSYQDIPGLYGNYVGIGVNFNTGKLEFYVASSGKYIGSVPLPSGPLWIVAAYASGDRFMSLKTEGFTNMPAGATAWG